MSLNYKSVVVKETLTNKSDDFIEIKKGKNNKINICSTLSYDKEYINEIINDNFELEYSGVMIEAKIDIENQIENDFYLKFKHHTNPKSKSLHDILKYNSLHYYKMKQDVHKNKSKYL